MRPHFGLRIVWAGVRPLAGRSPEAETSPKPFAKSLSSLPASRGTVEVGTAERRNRDGKGRHQRERHARRSRPGPGWRGRLRARRLGRSCRRAGSRRGGQGPARRGAGRRGPAVRSANLRVPRCAVAIPEWRIGGQVERHAQVRRVLDPEGSRLEQLDGACGRRHAGGLEAEGGPRRRDRRRRQHPARPHADGERPSRRAAAYDLPGPARGRRAPLRRDRRPKAGAPRRGPDRRRPRLPQLRGRPRRLADRSCASAARLVQPALDTGASQRSAGPASGNDPESGLVVYARVPFSPAVMTPGGSMRFLLTSAGIKNTSIHDALVDLLGKPIAESSALCIPTAIYANPGGAGLAWRFISGREDRTPMCELGWKSLGVLELTALPSIDEERWVPLVQETDVLLASGGDALYLCHWMRQSGLADLLPSLDEMVWVGLSAGSMVMTPRIGDDFVGWKPPTAGDETLGIVDFSIFPHLDNEDLPSNTIANAERWAAGFSGPAYAIDDQTAIKVTDGTVEVVSEGHWKLLTPSPV